MATNQTSTYQKGQVGRVSYRNQAPPQFSINVQQPIDANKFSQEAASPTSSPTQTKAQMVSNIAQKVEEMVRILGVDVPISQIGSSLPKAITMPTATLAPSATSNQATGQTLQAYDKQGNVVYVKPGEYNPGVSLNKPSVSSQTGVVDQTQQQVVETKPEQPVQPTFNYQEFLQGSGITKINKDITDALAGLNTQIDTKAIIDRLYPELPARVQEIDLELANMRASYEAGLNNIENQQIPMPLIVGQQAALERQYQQRVNSLAYQRDALMGKFDEAKEKAKLSLEYEFENKKISRENKMLAIEMMKDSASRAEQFALTALQRQLERQDKLDERSYNEKQTEQNRIFTLMSSNAQAFIGKSVPKTYQEALAILGQVKEKPTVMSVKGGIIEGTYDQSTGKYNWKFVPAGTGGGGEEEDELYSQWVISAFGRPLTKGQISDVTTKSNPPSWFVKEQRKEATIGEKTSKMKTNTEILSAWNNLKEQSSLRLKPVSNVKNLSNEQMSIVNDAKARLDKAKQLYEDVPSIRNAIIQKSIQEFGFDLSPYI